MTNSIIDDILRQFSPKVPRNRGDQELLYKLSAHVKTEAEAFYRTGIGLPQLRAACQAMLHAIDGTISCLPCVNLGDWTEDEYAADEILAQEGRETDWLEQQRAAEEEKEAAEPDFLFKPWTTEELEAEIGKRRKTVEALRP